ncbi:Alpha/Beta hydrolase protein [Armillaria mellea]|nr:Alpha/Beta hydrolase protein [Armillaria mellea]
MPFLSRVVFFLLSFKLFGISGNAPAMHVRAATVIVLTDDQITAYKPYTFFAAAAYCQPSNTMNWDCGSLCAGNSDFIPIASGGDGDDVQYWYVGYSPSLSTVIVAHQGTDVTEIQSLFTDIDFLHTTLNPDLFPGLSSHIKVHKGFKETQEKSVSPLRHVLIFTDTFRRLSNVSLVGHSLGAALSLLDAVYLPLRLPNATFRMVGYGMPRVLQTRFDPNIAIILPARFISATPIGTLVQDKKTPQMNCTDGAVGTIVSGSILDHLGPYDGVGIGVDGIVIRC